MEDSNISSNILKKIRLDLGLKQKDLKCKGIQNVSRLENGQAEITYTVATRLCDKINEIIDSKKIILDYDVTVDLLMGKTSILRQDLLFKLDKNKDDIIFNEINEVIYKLDDDEAIEFIISVINILNKDVYKYNAYICDYCYKILNYVLNINLRIDIFNYLISAHLVQNQFIAVVSIGRAILLDVKKFASNIQKEKFFGNVANAFYKLGMYNECECFLNCVIKFKDISSELYFISLRATCKSRLGEISESIKLYKTVIDKGIKNKQFEYVANSYSDIGDIYLNSDLEQANSHILKALEFTNMCTNKKFILNCYYNKFLLSIKQKDKFLIKEYFIHCMDISMCIDDNFVKNELCKNLIQFLIENEITKDICNLLLFINKKYNYSIEDSTLVTCLKNIKDLKLALKIIELARL